MPLEHKITKSGSELEAIKSYFANLDMITCAISFLPTTTPVKIASKPLLTYDSAAIAKYLEMRVYDYTDREVIAGKSMQDAYRQVIPHTIDPTSGRPVAEYEMIAVPPVIQRLNQAIAKRILRKEDITEEDCHAIQTFISLYLELNLEPDAVIARGMSLLFIACKFGLSASVTQLLDKGAAPNQVQVFGIGDAHERTPLYIATAFNHSGTIAALLRHAKADPNMPMMLPRLFHKTAAHLAVDKEYLESIVALAAHGADFSGIDTDTYCTPLFNVVCFAEMEFVRAMLTSPHIKIDQLQGGTERYSGKSALFYTVLKYFQKVEEKNDFEATQFLELTKMLIAYGANPDLVQQGALADDINVGKTPRRLAESKEEAGREILSILTGARSRLTR